MRGKELELITFEDDEGREEHFLVLEGFKLKGSEYAFLLAMSDEENVLLQEGKPGFLVMARDGEEFFEVSEEEQESVSKMLQRNLRRLEQKIMEFAGGSPEA
jgi:chloramphenicol O-acetyltransferase